MTDRQDPQLERLRAEAALLEDRLGGAERVAELVAARERVQQLRALVTFIEPLPIRRTA